MKRVLNTPRLTPNDEHAALTARRGAGTKQSLPKHMGWIVAAVVLLVPITALTIWAITHKKEEVAVLKQPDFAAAQAKWDASGISSYNLDLVFSGASQPKSIHVEVRDGQVTECLENGRSQDNEACGTISPLTISST